MDDAWQRAWAHLADRLNGPLDLRFYLQPMAAAILAARAGIADAREHRAPYFWSVLSHPGDRPQLLREGWKDVGKVFAMACAIDIVYQLLMFQWVYPVETIIVATLLALIPYLLLRGPMTRAARLFRHA